MSIGISLYKLHRADRGGGVGEKVPAGKGSSLRGGTRFASDDLLVGELAVA